MTRMMALACALLLGTPAQAETIQTRVPQANVDGFMASCGAANPRASCWCVVEALNATRDGQFVIDVTGLLHGNPKASREQMVQVLNRHGMRVSEGQAVAARMESMADAALKTCV